MKTTPEKKSLGSYYTPRILSDFIVRHLFLNYKFKKDISILEPSAGDGIFFESLFNNETFPAFKLSKIVKKITIDAVEKEEDALVSCKINAKGYLNSSRKIKYYHEDYLDYQKDNMKKYDLVIGNPPYIKYSHLSKHQVELCEAIHKQSHLSPKKIKNIWTSFLVSGVQSLNKDGVLCFVLPAELLQVIYAKELRDFLRDNFKRIEIFAFNDLIFPDIEQDVIILICAKKQTPGVSFYQVNTLDDLKKPTYVKENSNIHRETLDKWTNYVLSDSELKFLDSYKKRLPPIKNYCRAEVGVVTAANDFFIVDESTVKEFKLKKITQPILQKSSFMTPTVEFQKSDYNKILKAGKPVFLLSFKNKKCSNFSNSLKKYLKKGERLNLHKRYKCKLRDNWYFVPSVWKSEGFFTKRSNLIPKMAVNKANVVVTDAFYRIRMKDNNKIGDLVFSFYNSLTFIFAELEGRYYGGSVLELTPNEYKNLSIPYYKNVPPVALKKLDVLLRGKASIKNILTYTDELILKKQLGLSEKKISRIRKIYFKLLRRRLKGTQQDKSQG
jgi:adenine-specific DNA-methyltransferase